MTVNACIWLTGRAGAGKHTIARSLVATLRARAVPGALLDAETIAGRLVEGPDALAWCCSLLGTNGVVPVVAVPIATRDERELLREAVTGFVEVFLDAPADVCAERAGHADGEYEEPYAPDLRVPTHGRDVTASTAQIVSFLEDRGILAHEPPHPSES